MVSPFGCSIRTSTPVLGLASVSWNHNVDGAESNNNNMNFSVNGISCEHSNDYEGVEKWAFPLCGVVAAVYHRRHIHSSCVVPLVDAVRQDMLRLFWHS